ncbi:AraC family transcriptional regulator [Nakamurella aerolata]|uniref:AraC family transcriptional regulator n=1 Tax=Nakamurella aerolata TaxID=1656892 RepID=A0A849A884_9ACTN|nr:helix-turn-helix domain-containing protein [Nakamurella aerolata]NNG35318.1 AraC family transcriptional regulator [Nakamurella aerolata]
MAALIDLPIHPALAGLVVRCVPYRSTHRHDEVHLGLPSPYATVIVAFDEPLDVGWLADPHRHQRHWTSASGLHSGPALIRTNGYQHGIQLTLTPLGVRALFGAPIGAFANAVEGLADLDRPLPDAQYQRLAELPPSQRTGALQQLLIDRLGNDFRRARPELEQAWRLVTRSRGTAPVASVAAAVGWSRRQLHAQFLAEYGVSPKAAARIARFDHARKLADAAVPLAEVAAGAGFADQAHLTREFRSMAGRTPTQTRRTDYTFLQDLAVGQRASWQT